jgi:hypothetical protein
MLLETAKMAAGSLDNMPSRKPMKSPPFFICRSPVPKTYVEKLSC